MQSPLLRQMMKEQHLLNQQDNKPIENKSSESTVNDNGQFSSSATNTSNSKICESAQQPSSNDSENEKTTDTPASGDSSTGTSQPDDNLNDINWKALMAESPQTGLLRFFLKESSFMLLLYTKKG